MHWEKMEKKLNVLIVDTNGIKNCILQKNQIPRNAIIKNINVTDYFYSES